MEVMVLQAPGTTRMPRVITQTMPQPPAVYLKRLPHTTANFRMHIRRTTPLPHIMVELLMNTAFRQTRRRAVGAVEHTAVLQLHLLLSAMAMQLPRDQMIFSQFRRGQALTNPNIQINGLSRRPLKQQLVPPYHRLKRRCTVMTGVTITMKTMIIILTMAWEMKILMGMRWWEKRRQLNPLRTECLIRERLSFIGLYYSCSKAIESSIYTALYSLKMNKGQFCAERSTLRSNNKLIIIWKIKDYWYLNSYENYV